MIKLATVFSGIGAIEQAFQKKNIEHDIIFACDTGERYLDIDPKEINEQIKNLNYEEKQKFIKELYLKNKKNNFVKQSYIHNYALPEERWYDDIRFIDGNKYKNNIDLIVGGSPCQTFSIIGKRAGLDDARGTLFYDFARLIKETNAKVFIYENVMGLKTHDKGRTWKIVKEVFESLNYDINIKEINSVDHGIPQNRRRLFIVGFRKDIPLTEEFDFPIEIPLNTTLNDYLETGEIDHLHYLGEKGFKFVTNPKYKGRARVNRDIIQTEKANQQYNWNGDFIFEELDKVKYNDLIMKRAFVGEYEGKKGVIRQMTNRECLRLMGFDDSFEIVVPKMKAYRQAGNSIVVNVLEGIIDSIMKVVEFENEEN